MDLPKSDNTIYVNVAQHREALFIKCPRVFMSSRISEVTLFNSGLTVGNTNSDGEVLVTHRNPQTPEYWNQLCDWFFQELNNGQS